MTNHEKHFRQIVDEQKDLDKWQKSILIMVYELATNKDTQDHLTELFLKPKQNETTTQLDANAS